MKSLIAVLLSVMAWFNLIQAAVVVSQPGELKNIILDHDISDVTVIGEINAADFDFINSSLHHLESLDLSNATIIAYNGKTLANGRSESPANTLPEFSLTGSQIKSLKLPKTLKAIGDCALAGACITSLSIPDGVDSLGINFCCDCENLSSVSLPESVSYIPDCAFKGCTSLCDIQLPGTLTTIGNYAFRSCKALETITLPDNLSAIGNFAFNNCTALQNTVFPPGITFIGEEAFSFTAIQELDLKACSRLRSIDQWAFAHCEQLTHVTLPEGLNTMGDGIFFGCQSLHSVIMPTTVTAIAPYMLKGAAISNDDIFNENITTIGDYALFGNDRITLLTLPSNLTFIGDKAMANMTALNKLDATLLTELPELGNEVFSNTAGSDVLLVASGELAPAFRATPQWNEFKITTTPITGIDDISSDESKIGIRYFENILHITCDREITLASVFNISGVAVARSTPAGNKCELSIPLNLQRGSNVIIVIDINDGSRSTFKIIL